jgi:hypothetical protein
MGARALPLNDLSSVPISNLTRKVAGAAILASSDGSDLPKERTAALQF